MSKTFVGYINGQRYTNKQEFDQVVAETIKMGKDYAISSYYRDSNNVDSDNEVVENCTCDNCKSQPVPVVEYSELFPTLSFDLSNEMMNKLKLISKENRQELLNCVKTDINEFTKRQESITTDINYIEDRINKLTQSLNNLEDKLTDVDNTLAYLKGVQDNLQDNLNEDTNLGCTCDTNKGCDCSGKNRTGEKILDGDIDSLLEDILFKNDFYKFIKSINFI